MKPSAYQRHKYSGDLYQFVLKKNGSDEIVEFYFSKNIPLTAGIDANQRLRIITDEPISIGCLLANVKDREGVSLLGDMVWQVSTSNPILNSFGNVESYGSRLIKYQGEVE